MDELERSTPEPDEDRGKSRTAILILVALLSIISFVVETQAAPTYSFRDVDFPGAGFSEAFGLNDRGQVVGAFGTVAPPGEPPADVFGFLFSSGQFTPFAVPSPRQFATLLYSINNNGTIVGVSPGQGFLLEDGSFTPIIAPGASSTITLGINDRGDVVGIVAEIVDGLGVSHGFIRRQNGQFAFLPDPPGLEVPQFRGINNRGDIVGYGNDSSAVHAPHGFMFDGTTYTPIDVPGATHTRVLGINDRGQIVGWADGHGFLMDHQSFTLIDVPGARVTEIWGINNRGQIVGIYNDAQTAHGFLGTPVPETPSLLLLISGVLCLIALLGRAEPLGPKSRRGGRAHTVHRPGSVEVAVALWGGKR